MSNTATILIVDDDRDVLTAARLLLQSHYGRVLTTSNPEDIPARMRAEKIDVFLLDMNFAIGRNTGAEGLHWLQAILQRDPDAVVVLMTAFGDLNTAVTAMREGAADFVLKPWQNDKLVATLRVASELRRSRARVAALSEASPAGEMIAESAAMRSVLNVIARVAPTDATVLIRGENGTGKELVARALYQQSRRADKVLVAVDLGAISESLFESELFGHRQGAFTGAERDRAGRFQAADGGTLFLDEIGNLSAALQTRLLRALEAKEVTPLGADRPVAVDVRLIAASNQPLEALVQQGRFREDLLYRINTIEIHLPPLRDRQDDLRPLAEHFIRRVAQKHQLPMRPLSADGLAALRQHNWPGNIRELSHTIERAMLLGEGDVIGADDLNLTTARRGKPAALNLEANERYLIEFALRTAQGNISHAATALGITRAALYRRIEKFGL
ncbi:MAG TPA: sigma-54 dependent transcriptional regulator [Woeseiaceae bacterium]|nr:sigma-54 dependent transcriptional regulator [Woeseiaceae bacterium]